MTLDLTGLTKRQAQVLEMLTAGLQYKQIARSMNLSPRTIEGHVQRAVEASGAKTALQLAVHFDRSKQRTPQC